MHQPGKWWVGLIPLAIVWIACAIATTKRFEENAGAAALAAVVALGPDILDNPGVTVSGRDATFTGQTFDTPDTTLRAAAEGATGVRLVHVATVPTPTAKPYTIAFLRDGGDVVLSGNVPSPSERAELLAAATKSAAPSPVIDKLVYATGAPLGFKLMAMSGIEQTAALTSGRMSLSDNGFSIPGLAATTLSYEAALSAAQKFPAGFTLTKADILPPLKQPYAWSAQKNADGISLGGDAPTLESRAASATAAAALFAGAAVKNNLGIARGAPAGDFGAMTGLALGALTRLTSGTAILTDG
ncbi:MAG: uncharacterized protein JWL62_1634, partial [Hyphomicrobiales bacterium]|nr:uncharacterized protein [Hyphomicrobiales bacterium]